MTSKQKVLAQYPDAYALVECSWKTHIRVSPTSRMGDLGWGRTEAKAWANAVTHLKPLKKKK